MGNPFSDNILYYLFTIWVATIFKLLIEILDKNTCRLDEKFINNEQIGREKGGIWGLLWVFLSFPNIKGRSLK